MRLLIAIALALSAMPAAAIYQCKDANGRSTFQDAPCDGSGGRVLKVQPASGSATVEAPETAGRSPTNNDPSAMVRRMERTAEISRLEREIRDAEALVERDQRSMEREMDALQAKKMRARNNLAGATWEQSISTEMQAVADKYRARQDMNRAKIESLRMRRDALMDKP